MKGRLNVFQNGMLRWREIHPYNAVHVVRIEAPLDAARLQAVIDHRLAALGLTGLVVDVRNRGFEYRGGPVHSALRVLAGGADPEQVMCTEIERQLNEPFAAGDRLDPFRFFAVDTGASFRLGLTYDHFIAGGDSVVLLQKDLSEHYAGDLPDAIPSHALQRYPATYRRLILGHPWRVLKGMKSTWVSLASGRRAHRPHYADGRDMHNGFAAMHVGSEDAGRLRAVAKSLGVTQNDLLMAMLLMALSPLTEHRRTAARRNEIAIGSIINLRGEFDAAATTTFGQFLSSFHVSHAVPADIELRTLARDVHRQTAATKGERRYYQTLLGLGASNVILRFLSPARRARFHAKSFPLSAGITPLNADALWKEGGASHAAPDYLRAVSTGPLMPLVAAVTTAGGALAIGLSYRTAAFTGENIARIAAGIRDSIEHLCA